MRRLLDDGNAELRRVLETLLSDDVDITVREIARRHASLNNASAFIRNPKRLALIREAQQRQVDARHVKLNPESRRSASLSELLERRSLQVAKLESQVTALVASHAACVRAVMLHGGMQALERFWAEYKPIADAVRDLGAIPKGAEVIDLPRVGGKL
jgi:hypothetical protein